MLEALDLTGQRLGDPGPAALQADQHHAVEAVVALGDLVGDAGQRTAHVVGTEYLFARGPGHVHRSSRTGLTGPASRSFVGAA